MTTTRSSWFRSPTSTRPRTSIPEFAGVFFLHQHPLGGGRSARNWCPATVRGHDCHTPLRRDGLLATSESHVACTTTVLQPSGSAGPYGNPVHTAMEYEQWSVLKHFVTHGFNSPTDLVRSPLSDSAR